MHQSVALRAQTTPRRPLRLLTAPLPTPLVPVEPIGVIGDRGVDVRRVREVGEENDVDGDPLV